MLAFVLAAAAGLPTAALPPDQVAQKLDSVIVFAPIESSSSTSPKALNFELNGESRKVFFAAFSPAAVQQIINERLIPQKLKNAKNLKFAPFSLSKFDSLIQSKISNKSNYRVVYVPDPVQIPFAEDLLVAQGASLDDARKLTKDMPVIFCPQPAIRATPSSGPLKNKSFIPCSTDFNLVKNLVDKGIATNSALKKKMIEVVAIPITNFASMLATSKQIDIGEIKILPNPSNVRAIENLKK